MAAPRLSLRTALLLTSLLGTIATAQPSAHYVPGTEGIKAATLPPPGLYLRDYNSFYLSNRINDNNGDEIKAADFKSFVYAQVPRVLWITDFQLFGGYLGIDGLVPLVYQDVKANTPGGVFDKSNCSIADPFVEATISWHPKQFDLAIGVGEWIPAGEYDAPPSTKGGLGYWGTMFTAGATWYPDTEKTWSLSLLGRYEINCEQRDTDITPGHALTLEGGISKAIAPTVEVGLVGYYQRQITKDRGPGASRDRDYVVGLGPEIVLVFPKPRLFVSLRYLYEIAAENRAQGHTITLTLTHAF